MATHAERSQPTPSGLRQLRDLPGPRGLPLLGSLPELDVTRLHLLLERWCEQYGELYTFRLGPTRFLSVAEGEAMRRIFQARPESFRRLHTMESVARELGLHGLFSAEGEDWKRQRKLLAPAFRDEQLARAMPMLRTITERLLASLTREAARGRPCDVLHLLMRYTVDVSAAVAFGRDMNTLERGPDELQRDFETIFPMLVRRVNAPFPYWRYVKLPQDRALDRAIVRARSLMLPLIEAARAELERDPEERTLLHAMLAASRSSTEGKGLDDAEVLANVLTLLLAGEDTTANTLAWIFYFLATHPDALAKVRSEALELLGQADVLESYEDLARLRYLGAVTHETLRLKSPAPFVSLEAVTDVEVADVHVPAGTPVFLLTRHLSTRAEHFPEPLRFRPERWLEAEDGAARTQLSRTSLPFGAGPRICPGRKLALVECSMVISAVAKAFDLSLPPGQVVEEHFDFAMEPKGLLVNLRLHGSAHELASTA